MEGQTDLNRRSREIKEIEDKKELLTLRAVDLEKDVCILKGRRDKAGWQGETCGKEALFHAEDVGEVA